MQKCKFILSKYNFFYICIFPFHPNEKIYIEKEKERAGQ